MGEEEAVKRMDGVKSVNEYKKMIYIIKKRKTMLEVIDI